MLESPFIQLNSFFIVPTISYYYVLIPATATSSQRAPRELPELPSITMMTISGALIIQ
jgi:hypothetical protein